jgi:uncharacterized delta-60 repeat protein
MDFVDMLNMKHQIRKLVLLATLTGVISGCNGSDAAGGGPSDSLSISGGPTGSIHSGSVFSFTGAVSLLVSGSLASTATLTVDLDLFSDAACTTAASGTTTGLDSSVLLTDGTFSFSESPTFTVAHSEPKLYLEASSSGYGISACSSTYIQILQKFAVGNGFVDFQDGGAGAANAPSTSKWDTPYAIATDSQNRIVVVGYSLNAAGRYEMAIWRYQPDGTLDTSFASGNGFLTFNPGGTGAAGASNATKTDIASAVTITSTDQVVVAGRSKNSAGGSELTLWRYNTDGTLDTTFGTNGVVFFQHNSTGAAGAVNATKQDGVASLFVDSSGNYLIAGDSVNSTGGQEPVLWRYTPTGSLDTTFGSGTGFVIFEHNVASLSGASSATKSDYLSQTAQSADGGYVLAGAAGGSGVTVTAFWKTTATGSVDTSFGVSGALVINAGGAGPGGTALGSRDDGAQAIVKDSSGKFIAALYSNTAGGNYESILVKFDATGTLDPTYGAGNGIAVLTNGSNSFAGGTLFDVPNHLALDSSGNAVFSVQSNSASNDHEPVLVRATPSGTLDTTLEGQGWIDYAQAGVTGPGGASVGSKLDGYALPTIDGKIFDELQIPLLIDEGGRYLFAFSASTATASTFELSLSRFLSTGILDK